MNWQFWKRNKQQYKITDAGIKYIGHSRATNCDVIIIYWSATGIGFGELVIYQKGAKLYCDSEHMSREFVDAVMKRLLAKATYV
jgi:hypothetical protein